jgi:hypothetical protein
VFFSIHSCGKVYEFDKDYNQLELFMRRIIEIDEEIFPFEIAKKKRTYTSSTHGATTWKDHGRISHLAFSKAVSELSVFDGAKRMSLGIPLSHDQDGKLILIPSDTEGMNLFKKDNRMVAGCREYRQYITHTHYNVALSKQKNRKCLILTPVK